MNTNTIQCTTGTLTTQHAQIDYKKFFTTTTEHKTPLICVHGGPGFSHNNMLGLKELASIMPVVFYDQSGCGQSKPNDPNFSNWSLPYYVDELDDVIKGLGYSKVFLFGQSWGGMLNIQYTLDHQDKVCGLMLAGPLISSQQWVADCKKLAASLSPELAKTIAENEAAGATSNPNYEAAVGIFYKNFFCRLDPWPEVLVDSLNHLNINIYKPMWGPYEMTATGSLKNTDLSPQLGKITVPTLIICGQYDMASPESMQKYVKTMQNAKLVILENCSHCAHLEQPEKYLGVLKKFLAKQ